MKKKPAALHKKQGEDGEKEQKTPAPSLVSEAAPRLLDKHPDKSLFPQRRQQLERAVAGER